MSKLSGFSRTFWVANTIELFERFAYYGSKAILAVYIAEQVGLGPVKAAFLAGSLFNTLLYFLPILAGTVVDRYGFKKSLLACFSIFSVGYFLIGLGGLPAGKGVVDGARRPRDLHGGGPRHHRHRRVADQALRRRHGRQNDHRRVEGLGYSIYYTLVNLGGAIGPILALAGAREPRHLLRARHVVGGQRAPRSRHALLLHRAPAAGGCAAARARWAGCSPTWSPSSATCGSSASW